MRLLISLLMAEMVAGGQTFRVAGGGAGWGNVLRAMGLVEGGVAELVVGEVVAGKVSVVVGLGAVAESVGVKKGEGEVEVRQVRDVASRELPVVWEKAVKLPVVVLEGEWEVRTRERWTGAPLVAVKKSGEGAVVWVATEIGEQGYELYPFLPQTLMAAGVRGRVRGGGLWAFFDAGYRQRVDMQYLVGQWKRAGIGVIHVTSWQFDGAEGERARWLERLIAMCHEQLIQVYAWVELPHVSEGFWQKYPECREKTGTGMDASLDWRRLMTLVEPRCAGLAEENVLGLLKRFDWDGVNLGELYFESLEGAENAARMTPFHESVREEYRKLYGRNPVEEIREKRWADYRADLAARLQADWLAKLETVRRERPNFDIVVTHIDDRFDTRMREALGADAARVLRGTEGQGTAFVIEDPATVWHLGPRRYREIRRRYEGLTGEPERLAIDLNIVERYQDVYPTRRQTGAELAQLIHEAAASFEQVALYFEYSLRPVDLPLVGWAAARVEAWEESGGRVKVKLGGAGKLEWKGAARVNGMVWPVGDEEGIWLPAGEWEVERGEAAPAVRVREHNVRLKGVREVEGGYEIAYETRAGGLLVVERAGGEREWVKVGRGKGRVVISAKRPAPGPVESSSARLLRQQ